MPLSRQTITLKARLSELDRLVTFVDGFCAPFPTTEPDRHALHLALEEAFTNVVQHGYHEDELQSMELELELSAGQITATLVDEAPAFDPLAQAEVDTTAPLETRAIGGLGVHLIKKLMDSALYARRDGRNVLTLVRTIGSTR